MIATRMAHGAEENRDLRESPAAPGEGNRAWLARQAAATGIVLLGGASAAHFRIRVAQSHVRRDLLPSFWSAAGILVKPGRIATVPLERLDSTERVVRYNAVAELPAEFFDDPVMFPNLALLQFPLQPSRVAGDIEALKGDRSIVDLPTLVLRWLGYLWNAGDCPNPLRSGGGVPSAVFTETICGLSRVHLSPSLSSSASCPEAILASRQVVAPLLRRNRQQTRRRPPIHLPRPQRRLPHPPTRRRRHRRMTTGIRVRSRRARLGAQLRGRCGTL